MLEPVVLEPFPESLLETLLYQRPSLRSVITSNLSRWTHTSQAISQMYP